MMMASAHAHAHLTEQPRDVQNSHSAHPVKQGVVVGDDEEMRGERSVLREDTGRAL